MPDSYYNGSLYNWHFWHATEPLILPIKNNSINFLDKTRNSMHWSCFSAKGWTAETVTSLYLFFIIFQPRLHFLRIVVAKKRSTIPLILMISLSITSVTRIPSSSCQKHAPLPQIQYNLLFTLPSFLLHICNIRWLSAFNATSIRYLQWWATYI